MDKCFIIIRKCVIGLIDGMNWCDTRFFLCIEWFFHCHHMYGQFFLLSDVGMIFLYLCFFSIYSLILILESVSVYYFKLISVLNELLVWTLIQGMFEFPTKLSLFYLFKLLDFLVLACELTVLHIIFLEMH